MFSSFVSSMLTIFVSFPKSPALSLNNPGKHGGVATQKTLLQIPCPRKEGSNPDHPSQRASSLVAGQDREGQDDVKEDHTVRKEITLSFRLLILL